MVLGAKAWGPCRPQSNRRWAEGRGRMARGKMARACGRKKDSEAATSVAGTRRRVVAKKRSACEGERKEGKGVIE
jgi:hypothetical protein